MPSSQELQQQRLQKEQHIRAKVSDQLVMTGEKQRLKEMMRKRLMECGWKDEVKKYAKQIVREKGEFEDITVEDLSREIGPKAREIVPDAVKEEILREVRTFIEQMQLNE